MANFIFFASNFIGLIMIYFFIVETKKLSLEDMDSIFEAPYLRNRSFELVREAKKASKGGEEGAERALGELRGDCYSLPWKGF